MDHLLPVNKAYNLVLQVERQKEISGEINSGSEVSAMAAFRQEKSLGPLKYFTKKDYKEKKMEKALKRCDHCGKRGHVKEECFKIKGAHLSGMKTSKRRNISRLPMLQERKEAMRRTHHWMD